jgi:hypothetical protein
VNEIEIVEIEEVVLGIAMNADTDAIKIRIEMTATRVTEIEIVVGVDLHLETGIGIDVEVEMIVVKTTAKIFSRKYFKSNVTVLLLSVKITAIDLFLIRAHFPSK